MSKKTKALIFISNHPGSLVDYNDIRKHFAQEYTTVLFLCEHPYVNQDIKDLYVNQFDFCITLPNIDYLGNIFIGFLAVLKFKKLLRDGINKVLKELETFDIVSDCSAFLPVNVGLTQLQKMSQYRRLFDISGSTEYGRTIRIVKSVIMMVYSLCFRLSFAYSHKKLGYRYYRRPPATKIRLKTKFSGQTVSAREGAGCDEICLLRPLPPRDPQKCDLIVFFSDLQSVDIFQSDLTRQEREQRLEEFFQRLIAFYSGCRILCKPHPLDQGRVLSVLENVPHEVYDKYLTSEMYFEQNASRIRACYAISSLSILSSADRGIPSYSLYRYLTFHRDVLDGYFASEEARQKPFLYNVEELSEIGAVDDVGFKIENGDCVNNNQQVEP